MSNTATIYRIRVTETLGGVEIMDDWSLEPWGMNTAHLRGEDDGGKLYALPEGVHVGVNALGFKGIYSDERSKYPLRFDTCLKDGVDLPLVSGLGPCLPIEPEDETTPPTD